MTLIELIGDYKRVDMDEVSKIAYYFTYDDVSLSITFLDRFKGIELLDKYEHIYCEIDENLPFEEWFRIENYMKEIFKYKLRKIKIESLLK